MGDLGAIGALHALDLIAAGLAGAALIAIASATGVLRRIRDRQYQDMDLAAGYDATMGAFAGRERQAH